MRNKTSPQKTNNKSEVTLLQCNTQIFEDFIKEMQAARKQREKEIEQMIKDRVKSEKELKAFTKSMKEMQKEIGGISKSNGEMAESYFINSFDKSMQFAGQKYDSLGKNVTLKNKALKLQGEYDLVLYNCSSVVIIEIKYKARKEDVEELEAKAFSFKQLFPEYAHYDIYLGLAGLHINVTAEKEALKKGIAVIKQEGDSVVINDGHLKVF